MVNQYILSARQELFEVSHQIIKLSYQCLEDTLNIYEVDPFDGYMNDISKKDYELCTDKKTIKFKKNFFKVLVCYSTKEKVKPYNGYNTSVSTLLGRCEYCGTKIIKNQTHCESCGVIL